MRSLRFGFVLWSVLRSVSRCRQFSGRLNSCTDRMIQVSSAILAKTFYQVSLFIHRPLWNRIDLLTNFLVTLLSLDNNATKAIWIGFARPLSESLEKLPRLSGTPCLQVSPCELWLHHHRPIQMTVLQSSQLRDSTNVHDLLNGF